MFLHRVDQEYITRLSNTWIVSYMNFNVVRMFKFQMGRCDSRFFRACQGLASGYRLRNPIVRNIQSMGVLCRRALGAENSSERHIKSKYTLTSSPHSIILYLTIFVSAHVLESNTLPSRHIYLWGSGEWTLKSDYWWWGAFKYHLNVRWFLWKDCCEMGFWFDSIHHSHSVWPDSQALTLNLPPSTSVSLTRLTRDPHNQCASFNYLLNIDDAEKRWSTTRLKRASVLEEDIALMDAGDLFRQAQSTVNKAREAKSQREAREESHESEDHGPKIAHTLTACCRCRQVFRRGVCLLEKCGWYSHSEKRNATLRSRDVYRANEQVLSASIMILRKPKRFLEPMLHIFKKESGPWRQNWLKWLRKRASQQILKTLYVLVV